MQQSKVSNGVKNSMILKIENEMEKFDKIIKNSSKQFTSTKNPKMIKNNMIKIANHNNK